MADDGGGGPAGAIQAAGAGGRQPLDKFNLPHRAQLHRAIRAVHGAGLDKHGCTHVVAAVHIGDQLVQQIALVGNALRAQVPEVMVGIADGQLWLHGRFLSEGQPVIASVWHKSTSVAECRGARSAHGRRSPVMMRHDGVSVFPCVARQHTKKPSAPQSWSASATVWYKVLRSCPYPNPPLPPRKVIRGCKEVRAIEPYLTLFGTI